MLAGFIATVTALIGRPLAEDEPFAVAVSGGPDSLALLSLAHAAFGDRVRALTVDHGLRLASADEANLATRAATGLGVAHVTLHWAGPYPGSNLQAAARVARYRLMGDWCAANNVGWLTTAHHADDAAETLLMRLARGSGSGGLAGVRARRRLQTGVELIRPLLGTTKAELARVVADTGWTTADDPSNRSPRFDRTRTRVLLAATSWLAPARLAASAAHLAQVEAALAWTAEIAWHGRTMVAADRVIVDPAGLPRELARRLLLRAIASIAPGLAARGPAIDRLLDRLEAGVGGTIGGVAAQSIGDRWHFKAAAPRRIFVQDAARRR